MANRILTAADWQQRIRDKLGVDAAYLPDSAIEQPDIITVAEANIIEQVPDYESLTGDKRVYLEAAVVAECCALLCTSMPARLPRREQGPHAAHEVNIDWEKKRAEYEAERDSHIGRILADSFPTLLHFGISNPIREWEG